MALNAELEPRPLEHHELDTVSGGYPERPMQRTGSFVPFAEAAWNGVQEIKSGVVAHPLPPRG
jgi:hypothetical protein